MARIDNLTNFLTDVAAAIKTKLDDSTDIPAAQFDTKIMDIETAGIYQEKSITISSNGTVNLLPDTGFDAMSKVSITTTVSSNTQEKSVTISSNGTTNITPDSGYDSMTKVVATVNVPTSVQTKTRTITTNTSTEITPDSGYIGMSKVTITTNVPMQNTSDYSTCLQLARAILGDVELLDDPYVTYNVTVNVTDADQIAISNRDLVITTPGGA